MKQTVLYFTVMSAVIFFGFYFGYMRYSPGYTINKPMYDDIVITPAEEGRAEEARDNPRSARQHKITPSTKIVYEYYYEDDGKTQIFEEEPPYFLIDETEEHLRKAFVNWEIVSFDETEVVMRKSIEGRSNQHYTVGERGGYVAVFYKKEINGDNLKEITNMPVSALPVEEQERLEKGIDVSGENELHKILEDYGS